MAIDILAALTHPPPPIDEVLPGLVAGTVGILAGPGASGKSMWALQAAIGVAGGPDLLQLGIRVKGRVYYLAAEDPEAIIIGRLYLLGEYISAECRHSLSQMLIITPQTGLRLDIMETKHIQKIIENSQDARLIIIDTLNRMHGLEENSNGDMGRLTVQLEYISQQTGAAVLHLHHVSKNATRLTEDDQHAARGASALSDNARWAAGLRVMSEGEASKRGINAAQRHKYVRWSVVKCNYTTAPCERWFERHKGGILLPLNLPESQLSKQKGGRRDEI
jgi:RecA-family ATPase